MSHFELNDAPLPRLPLGRLPIAEPSADLWQRIAAAQLERVQRRRRRFAFVGAGTLAVALLLAIGFGASGDRSPARDAVDWQARAQALELQLRELAASRPAGAAAIAGGAAQDELVLVDAALQAAYDEGGERERIDALWKRRSELLGTLLQARTKDVEISRI